ncbi:MAG: L-threonine 3-dehydrogenase [Caldicoprobacterales bacterium]|jgi:nucleoside-diphosphate-sugar epimerase|nr:L-threonine 3-dehydrogenase [Clostridiales bacterium]
MNKILVTGSLGQIGSELVVRLQELYGDKNVIASDVRKTREGLPKNSIFEVLDVTDSKGFYEIVKKHEVDTIIHLAALLSSVGEQNPQKAWHINMGGLYNALEVSRELGCALFTPSSIAAFGPSTPKDNTPQDTIQRPDTIYGVSKVSGELLCDYYHKKYGVDTRGVRFPGLISYKTLPGGGTTDYAVEIYYEALRSREYTCYIEENTKMDMMYMPDAIDAIIDLMEADSSKLIHRNAFNITAMSFSPKEIAAEIKKFIPDFKIKYDIDPVRQAIAESWPNSIDATAAKEEWGFRAKYDLTSMTEDMLDKLSEKLQVEFNPPAA